MTFVFLQFSRQQTLIAKHRIINKRNTGNPVAFRYFSIRLQVILTTGEIPHKIAPVHEIDLISEEETQVFAKSRTIVRFLLSAIVIFDAFTFDIRPFFVCRNMTSLR